MEWLFLALLLQVLLLLLVGALLRAEAGRPLVDLGRLLLLLLLLKVEALVPLHTLCNTNEHVAMLIEGRSFTWLEDAESSFMSTEPE